MSNNILEFTPKSERKDKIPVCKLYGVCFTLPFPIAIHWEGEEIENIESFEVFGDFIDKMGIETTKDLLAEAIEQGIKDVDIFKEEEYLNMPIYLRSANNRDELYDKLIEAPVAGSEEDNIFGAPHPIYDTEEFIKWGERPENKKSAKVMALDIAKACVRLAEEKKFYA